METAIIPQTYEEWHHCITVVCDQELTLPFIQQRIAALNALTDYKTKRFVELYGDEQRIKTLQWFEQAKSTLA